MPISFAELQAERLVRQIIASPNLPRARKHDMEEDARNGLSDEQILLNLRNSLKRSEPDTDDRDCLRWLETELDNRIAIGPHMEALPGSQEAFETSPTTLAQWLDSLGQQDETELTDERCVEISNLSELFLEHWIELTGIGIGECRPYLICVDSITFIKWDDAFIAAAPRDWQRDMVRDNRTAPQLTFPCTPTELMQFIDTAVGAHRFSVPDAFRQHAISQSTIVEMSETESDSAPSPALTDFRNMDRLSWNEIQIDFVAGDSGSALLNVSARKVTRRIALAELELINRKTGEMNHQGGVLLALASGHRAQTNSKMPRRLSRLRTALKKHFGIDSDPFETYCQQAGYKPVFVVYDKRDAADERAKKNAERKTLSFEDWQEHKSTSEDKDIVDDDSNDDETTRWFKANAPDMLDDNDLSR